MKLFIFLKLYFLLCKMDSDKIISALETEFEDFGSDFITSELSDFSDESIEDVTENSQFDFEYNDTKEKFKQQTDYGNAN